MPRAIGWPCSTQYAISSSLSSSVRRPAQKIDASIALPTCAWNFEKRLSTSASLARVREVARSSVRARDAAFSARSRCSASSRWPMRTAANSANVSASSANGPSLCATQNPRSVPPTYSGAARVAGLFGPDCDWSTPANSCGWALVSANARVAESRGPGLGLSTSPWYRYRTGLDGSSPNVPMVNRRKPNGASSACSAANADSPRTRAKTRASRSIGPSLFAGSRPVTPRTLIDEVSARFST